MVQLTPTVTMVKGDDFRVVSEKDVPSWASDGWSVRGQQPTAPAVVEPVVELPAEAPTSQEYASESEEDSE